MEILNRIKTNNIQTQRRNDSKSDIDIKYVAEIPYENIGHQSVRGISNIWMHRDNNSKKVSYIVEITGITRGESQGYQHHVMCALETLCRTRSELIFKALHQFGFHISLNESIYNVKIEIEQYKSKLENDLKDYKKRLEIINRDIIEINNKLYSQCEPFSWTFTM